MLGDLSREYEVGPYGDCGTISTGKGDTGGKSYGLYQFASKMGTVDTFCKWLASNDKELALRLVIYPMGSEEFDNAWKAIAEEFPERFSLLQHDFTKYKYYDVAVDLLNDSYFQIEKHSETMKDVIWSRAVQNGTSSIVKLFENTCNKMGHPNLSYINDKYFDAKFIEVLYKRELQENPIWIRSRSLRYALIKRFNSECEKALEMLKKENLGDKNE